MIWAMLIPAGILTALGTGWLLYGLWNQYQDARAVIAITEAEARGNQDCDRCSGRDLIARCTCPGNCPHPDCIGDYTTHAGFTATDMAVLHEWFRRDSK